MDHGELQVSREDFAALAGELLGGGTGFTFRARGTSMSPFIRDGDVIEVVPIKARPRLGEVVMVEDSRGRLLVHRVVAMDEGGVVTRGDAAAAPDDPAPFEAVVGRVLRVTGRGYNFHLKRSWGYLIIRRDDFPFRVLFSGPLRRAGKKIADLLR